MSHGRHVKIIGHGFPEVVGDVDVIRDFLCGLIVEVGMRALGEPTIHDVELDIRKMNAEPFEDEGGVTGVVVLSTSHCAIHTWPLRNGFFSLDLYSCRDFDPVLVQNYVGDTFLAHAIVTTDFTEAVQQMHKDLEILCREKKATGESAK